jgi:hypothetical protein
VAFIRKHTARKKCFVPYYAILVMQRALSCPWLPAEDDSKTSKCPSKFLEWLENSQCVCCRYSSEERPPFQML